MHTYYLKTNADSQATCYSYFDIRFLCILFLMFFSFRGVAQKNYFAHLKTVYERLRKEEKHDSALMYARQMNRLAMSHGGDTGRAYIFSSRELGKCFTSMQKMDSAAHWFGIYFNKSEKYRHFSDKPLEVARQLEAYAYGKYRWPFESGMPIDIFFKSDSALFKKTPDGSTFCSGYTFAAFYIAALNRGLLNNYSNRDVIQLQKTWFHGKARNQPRLLIDALTRPAGNGFQPLGFEVTFEEARPGDFAQIWRSNGSGHSVIFIEKIFKDGKPAGFRYYSSNNTINTKTGRTGAGERVEMFSDFGGKMLKNKTYFARLNE